MDSRLKRLTNKPGNAPKDLGEVQAEELRWDYDAATTPGGGNLRGGEEVGCLDSR